MTKIFQQLTLQVQYYLS